MIALGFPSPISAFQSSLGGDNEFRSLAQDDL